MTLESVNLVNFRNFLSVNVFLEDNRILLFGPNAQGKTNFLEAIYFNSRGDSFRRILPDAPINWGKTLAKIEVKVKKGLSENILTTIFKTGGLKRIFINGKKITKKSQLQNYLSAFYFSPQMERYVSGEPELRRKIFDGIISQKYQNFNFLIANYYKILKYRNYLLRRGKFDESEIWEDSLIKTAVELISLRQRAMSEFKEYFKKAITEIGQNDSQVDFKIKVKFRGLDFQGRKENLVGQEVVKTILKESFARFREVERKFKKTLIGPHLDEFNFVKDGQDLRFCASRGEALQIMAALKIAHFDYLQAGKNESVEGPVFLVDDLLQELDNQRSELLLKALDKRGQVIVATAHPESIPEEFFKTARKFLVQGKSACPIKNYG